MKAHWIDDEQPIGAATLHANGVIYEALPLDEAGYQGRLEELKHERGYGTQDVVALEPDNPKLDEICNKFADEHLHSDDEVRFVLEGEGLFDIRSNDDRWMRVLVEPGDLIVVPEGKHHRFTLTEQKRIRCLRLFKDQEGWVPIYREQSSGA